MKSLSVHDNRDSSVSTCNSISGGSCRQLAVEWKVAGSSPAVVLINHHMPDTL